MRCELRCVLRVRVISCVEFGALGGSWPCHWREALPTFRSQKSLRRSQKSLRVSQDFSKLVETEAGEDNELLLWELRTQWQLSDIDTAIVPVFIHQQVPSVLQSVNFRDQEHAQLEALNISPRALRDCGNFKRKVRQSSSSHKIFKDHQGR